MKIHKIMENTAKLSGLAPIVPFRVTKVFGAAEELIFFKNQVSLGEDSVSIEDVRIALDWYVDQFDGEVTWGD